MFKNSRRWLYRLVAATMVFAALFGAIALSTVRAAPPVGQIELTGTITAIGTGTLTVNSLTIDTTQAEINTTLMVGDVVVIEGTLASDGTILAREVNAPEAKAVAAKAEITGTVDSITGNIMVINGQNVDVSNAEVAPGVVVGSLVKVEGTLASDGTLLASQVKLVSANEGKQNEDNSSGKDGAKVEDKSAQPTATPVVDDHGAKSGDNHAGNSGGDNHGGGGNDGGGHDGGHDGGGNH